MVVGCFQGLWKGVGVTEAMALGYALTSKALRRVTSGWLEGGSRASPGSAAVLEVVWEAYCRVPECQNACAGGDLTLTA